MAVLELNNITKQYGDFYASNDISFDIKKGEFVTLLGPSGCGKTTLLKMIAGFIEPTSGDIVIHGNRVNDLSPQKRPTAMCFQSYALFPHLSVSHNICFGMEQQKVAKAEMKSRLKDVLVQMGLWEHKDKLPSELSGGQQQRVALGRAMATRPDIILFDEPLSNLDAKMRGSVRIEIKALQKKHNLTSVYVTHDQSEALAMSDKIVILNQGKIEQIGTPKEIYYQPVNRFVADFIGDANILEAKVTSRIGYEKEYNVDTNMGNFIIKSEENAVSSHIYICWRPEDAKLAQEGDTNTFTAKVKSVSFLGNNIDIIALVGENFDFEVRIQLNGRDTIEEGEVATFSLATNNLRLLEEVTP